MIERLISVRTMKWACLAGIASLALLVTAPQYSRADVLNGTPGPVGDDPPLIIDGGWQDFSWNNAPGTFNNEGPFTFTTAVAVVLKVTDAFIDGDQFEVYDGANLLGTTSTPADDGASQPDYDAAYADPRWSSGSWLLGPGTYSISMKTIAIATGFPDGGGAIRADTAAVPEPSSLALCGVAIATGMGYAGWRRRRREVIA